MGIIGTDEDTPRQYLCAYLWITVKAFGFALVGVYATRTALYAYEIVKWGV